VLKYIPAIWNDDASIVRDELMPFFDFDTQFFSQLIGGESKLTTTDEMRISYSFWTSWVRYNKILPFALFFLNVISAFILFYSVYVIAKYFYKRDDVYLYFLTFSSSSFLHFLLLYSKITHFYSLIFGFSFFALSLSLTLLEFGSIEKIKKSRLAAIVFLVLFNPAIHYHVLYYFIVIIFIVTFWIILWVSKHKNIWLEIKRSLLVVLWVFILSAIPYALFISFVTSRSQSSVETSIPVNYWMIYFTSNSLTHLFSLDTTAQIDMFRWGNYLIEKPRIIKMGVVIFFVTLLFFGKHVYKRLNNRQTVLLESSLVIFLISFYMSIGYVHLFSFHSILQSIALNIANSQFSLASLFNRMIFVFIQILRFPHRFTFIEHYFFIILCTVFFLLFIQYIKQKQRWLIVVLFICILIMPLLFIKDYREVLVSGNFDSYLHAYTIPQDLKNIKKIINQNPNNYLFILPSLESGRDIVVTPNMHYSFIDKYFIYYLNQPTFYYGVGANVFNKFRSFMVYRSILYGEDWWDEYLFRNIGITHILVPKSTQYRVEGLTYARNLEEILPVKLEKSNIYHKIYNGNEFDLYEIISPDNRLVNELIDLPWSKLTSYLNVEYQNNKENLKSYFPIQYSNFISQKGVINYLVTDNIEKSFYSLYFALNNKNNFYPSQELYHF
jgi:hypothetical protein